MMQRTVLLVPEDSLPDRLDRYLGEHAPGLSRTRAKEIILEGLVTVNGVKVKPSTEVKPGDMIEANVPLVDELAAEPEPIPLDVCYEDDHIIVINKPAGMVVHPGPGWRSGTLVNALLSRCGSLSTLGGSLRPGIVHRLDKNTSGLIVVAKDDVSHRSLSSMLEERRIEKTYLALVWGTFRDREGRTDGPIGRSRRDRKKMAVAADGRAAATRWLVREDLTFATFLEVRPETGRTHQIRVHMAHSHHPVMGDEEYGGTKRSFGEVPPHYRRLAKRANGMADRQMLHARALAFEHPISGDPMKFAVPLPEDFAELLFLLRHPKPERGRVVGVDPGEARVGVAASDEMRMVAHSLDTLEVSSGDAGGAVARIALEQNADTIVVGYPIRMDGSVGPRARRALELAVAIEDASRARVVLWDERLSSVEAERILMETGERVRGRKGRIDQLAAAIILQGFLDSKSTRRDTDET